jgi:hypothetical protein
MTESPKPAGASGPPHRTAEIAVALMTFIFGMIAIYGSLQVGVGWGIEGPRAGFFPFYVGLTIVVASLVNLARAVIASSPQRAFADWEALRRVFSVLVPALVYVLAIPYVGIYAASALLIGLFMKWLGRYGWPATLLISLGLPIAVYLVFEKWFLIPLPKGPIEEFFEL